MKKKVTKILSMVMTMLMVITMFITAVPVMAEEHQLPVGATIRFEMDDGTVIAKYEFKEDHYTPAKDLGITGGYEENDPGYVTPLHMLAQAMIDNDVPVNIEVSSNGWVYDCNGTGGDLMYYVNGADSSALFGGYEVKDGDNITVIECNFKSGLYTAFGYFGEVVEDTFEPVDMTEEAVLAPGEELTLKYSYKGWNTGNDVAVGAEVYVSEKDGILADQKTDIVTDENGEFTISFKEAGTYIVSARSYLNDGRLASNPYCKVTVKENQTLPFADVTPEDWFYDAVRYVYENGIMTGIQPTVFDTAAELSRAQFTVTLYRMNGQPEITNKNIFADVPDGTWYTDAVLWANSVGIVNGYRTGDFGPADSITREQMAVMMYRYAGYKGYDTEEKGELSQFQDGSEVSAFAEEAMKWAVGNHLISGKENQTKIDPQGNTNRAECAAIIMRFMKTFESGK